jgi:hypothetical protein
VDIETLLPEAQSVRLLAGLNRVIYQELHHQLNNLPHFKMEYPKDLATAKSVAVNYVPSSHVPHTSQERSVYSTSSNQLQKKKSTFNSSSHASASSHASSSSHAVPTPTHQLSFPPHGQSFCKYC